MSNSLTRENDNTVLTYNIHSPLSYEVILFVADLSLNINSSKLLVK